MSVVPFRRAAPAASAAPAVMPSAAETEEALRTVRHAIVALGTIDFAGLGDRILRALEAEQDADLDNSADAAWHLRASEAHALFIVSTFRDTFTAIDSARAKSKGGGDAAR